MRRVPPSITSVVGLAGSLLLAVLPMAVWISPGTSIPALLVHEAVWWSYGVAVLLWLRYMEHLPFSSIGLRRPSRKTLLWGVVGGLLLLLRASVIEEILFRGYIIEKVKQLTGSTVLACLISICTFTYAHLSAWGLAHLIPVGLSGVVLALLYIWKRDLPANILAHFIADGAGFLFG